jgi:hypothetical protein
MTGVTTLAISAPDASTTASFLADKIMLILSSRLPNND